jgi:acetyltransferase-like isoleucine patch superfamily enzyme
MRIEGPPASQQNLRIGAGCWINCGCVFHTPALITIGDRVQFGPDVMVLSGSHDIGPRECRAGANADEPVWIGNGCWLGARSVILPGVRIGDGAIVAAGAVVTQDVPPDCLVAGVPARVVRQLPPAPAAGFTEHPPFPDENVGRS